MPDVGKADVVDNPLKFLRRDPLSDRGFYLIDKVGRFFDTRSRPRRARAIEMMPASTAGKKSWPRNGTRIHEPAQSPRKTTAKPHGGQDCA
jgi:hypothetical protein